MPRRILVKAVEASTASDPVVRAMVLMKAARVMAGMDKHAAPQWFAGIRAESLLAEIPHRDIATLARIEFVAGIFGIAGHSGMQVVVRRPE